MVCLAESDLKNLPPKASTGIVQFTESVGSHVVYFELYSSPRRLSTAGRSG